MTQGLIIGIIAGVIGGIIGPLLLVMIMPRKKCPDCGELLSRMRNCWNTPKVMRRCTACGCGVDVRGQKVDRKRPPNT